MGSTPDGGGCPTYLAAAKGGKKGTEHCANKQWVKRKTNVITYKAHGLHNKGKNSPNEKKAHGPFSPSYFVIIRAVQTPTPELV